MKLSAKSWVKLPLALKQLPGITRAAADVGAVLIHTIMQGEPVRLSEVAQCLGLHVKTVKRAVIALEAAGLICVNRRRGSVSYYIIPQKLPN